MSAVVYSGSMDSYFRHCADENARERELYRLQREDETRETTHHVDCDGYRFDHVGRVDNVHPSMVQATCERCDWHGPLYGPAAATHARTEANQHTAEVRCDGRCQDWTER